MHGHPSRHTHTHKRKSRIEPASVLSESLGWADWCLERWEELRFLVGHS